MERYNEDKLNHMGSKADALGLFLCIIGIENLKFISNLTMGLIWTRNANSL